MPNLKDMQDQNFRTSLFKEVFGSESGKLMLEYLLAVYDKPTFIPDANQMYFTQGQRQVVREIEMHTKAKIKTKKG